MNRLAKKSIRDLKVYDEAGNIIDWEETGFPVEMKRIAFRIFPGAILESHKEFRDVMDFEVKANFFIPILTYLLSETKKRIGELSKQLSNGYQNKL